MGALARFALGLFVSYTTVAFADPDPNFYKMLAEYHAPVLVQELGKNPKVDIPTRYDFDGDEYADNNWVNIEKFDIQPLVYYEVIESKTHYFITYAFYHARDYTNFWFCMPRLCHENDLEGGILTVRKGEGFGKLEFVEMLAHLNISNTTRPYTYLGNSHHVNGVVQRAVMRIEPGGHGVHAWSGEYPKKFELLISSDDTSTPRIDKKPLHYNLIPIRELWTLRSGRDIRRVFDKFFDYDGRFQFKNLPRSFAGKKFGDGLASLPWAWGEVGAKRGEWFLDPAYWVYNKMKKPANFSLEYVHHPYLQEALAPTAQQRELMAEHKPTAAGKK